MGIIILIFAKPEPKGIGFLPVMLQPGSIAVFRERYHPVSWNKQPIIFIVEIKVYLPDEGIYICNAGEEGRKIGNSGDN